MIIVIYSILFLKERTMRHVGNSYLKPKSILPFLMALPFIATAVAIDKYTQSQAHMSLPEIKNAIEKTYNTKPYQAIISQALAREQTYKNDYYVFYHGLDYQWRLAQDVYTRLYAHYHPEIFNKNVTDFIFLRFGGTFPSLTPKEFLLGELYKNGLINDHGAMGEKLLSANLALFGNVGVPSECSWEYFMKSRKHLNPDAKIYEKIMDHFGLPHTYIKELLSLIDIYKTKEEMLLQIFVPKNVVDEIGYEAWIRGNPAQEELMDWVLASVRSKRYPKTQQSLDALTALFKNEQEKNPIFRDLITEVKENRFKLSSFLHIYRNDPASIKNINSIMARLIITSAILLNPRSGVKMFRYSTATDAQLKHYDERLNEIMNKITAEKPSLIKPLPLSAKSK